MLATMTTARVTRGAAQHLVTQGSGKAQSGSAGPKPAPADELHGDKALGPVMQQ